MSNRSETIGRFMIAVGVIVEHPLENKILIIKRQSELNDKSWELMYGRVNQGEELFEALQREVKEELGLDKVDFKIKKFLRTWHIYRGAKKPENELYGFTFVIKSTTDLIKLSAEHSEYKWVSPQEALKTLTLEGVKQDIQLYIENNSTLAISNLNLEVTNL